MPSRCLSRSLVAVALAALVAAAASSDPRSARADDAEWVQLFNGKDLTGWKIPNPPTGEFKGVKEVKNDDGKVTAFVGVLKDKKDGTPGKEVTLWQVKDGTIVGGGPASHIFTELQADNFVYRVEAKINDKGNSGQYFRTKFEGGFPAGYEAQINATHSDWRRSGSLYPDGRTKLKEFEKDICVKEAPHKADEFFTQEVTADGNHIVIKVNGKVMTDFKDPNNTFTKGHFALQGHDPGSVMTFRKVEYMPLKK